MKKGLIKLLFIFFVVNTASGQGWMTNLDIAQKLASVQNKMVLMVWEETTKYSYPIFVNDENGNTLFVNNLFEDENISPLIWKHFVPVIVSDNHYSDLFSKIKGKRSQKYIDKFNDDSIKIMDVNGNILNLSRDHENFENITTMILKYGLNTEFIAQELKGYQQEQDFYSTYYLASKYLDFAMYVRKEIRPELIDLTNIYLDEAYELIETSTENNKLTKTQRVELSRIQESLITKNPKKVLRQLKRMDAINAEPNNQQFVAFLYYTAYSILKDETNIEIWKSKVSSVNLKKAQLIINLNSN